MGKPRCTRIVAITIGSRMAAMIVTEPPLGTLFNIDNEHPFEQPAQLIGAGAAGGGASAWSAEWVLALTGTFGIMLGRNLALRASTPWKRMRCNRRCTTSATNSLHEFQR